MGQYKDILRAFTDSELPGVRVKEGLTDIGMRGAYQGFGMAIQNAGLKGLVRVVKHDGDLFLVKVPKELQPKGFKRAARNRPYVRMDERLERILVRRYGVPQELIKKYRDQFDTDDYGYYGDY